MYRAYLTRSSEGDIDNAPIIEKVQNKPDQKPKPEN